MSRKHAIVGAARGFSLIEVLIAVVVLSTGLLALAALQGNLTRASAEAKVRGRVAALLTARMDQLRVGGYDSIANGANDTCSTGTAGTPGDWVPAAFCTDTGIGALDAVQQSAEWKGAIGGSGFSQGTPGATDAHFKRVTIQATWKDSSGSDHRLSMSSDFSSLALVSNLLPPPDEESSKNLGPIVRQDNPATDGMIPIAIGGDGHTAATNPKPEIVGDNKNQKIVGTKFDVLTYSGTSEATIQKRFENEVIQCQCQYGVSNNEQNGVRATPQWPAIWTGERYEVYEPNPKTLAAPGAATPAGPAPDAEQSPLCTECCRDHHDGTETGVAKFDPERSGAHTHFASDGAGGLLALANTTNSSYVEACRMIRVDGLWRTAADTYARHFALLETKSVSGIQAKTGLPADSAVTAYQAFVKDYLDAYDGSSATPPASPNDADTKFAATTIADTPDISIAKPSPSDKRYMHARGLYVDYLEDAARTKISDVLTEKRAAGLCLAGGSDMADCVLPYLPFTTINVTELANWSEDDPDILSVNNVSGLEYFPDEPSRGRTLGDSVGEANALVDMGKSNAALALDDPIDWDGTNAGTGDQATAADTQKFVVGGTPGTGSGDDFYVDYNGLSTQTPNTIWTVDASSNECQSDGPGDRRCTTESTLAGQGGSITLSGYQVATTTSVTSVWTCGSKSGTFTVATPAFQNWSISSAFIKFFIDGSAVGTQVDGSVGTPLPTDGNNAESTTVAFASIPKDGLIEVNFTNQNQLTTATPDFTSCKITGNNPGTLSPRWQETWAQ
jgi:type IV pilus modification protein PilV